MALKRKSLIGYLIALAVIAVAAVTGGIMAKADSQTWTSSADTKWYVPTNDTYQITKAAELAGVAKLVNEGTGDGLQGKILEITDNLDLGEHVWIPIGTAEHPFRGTLITKDGLIKTISGMNVVENSSYQGLVGNMEGGTVGGLSFNSGSISVTGVTYDVYAGAAVGKMSGSSIVFDITNNINITTHAAPYHSYTGGIVGMGEGMISNSINNGAVTAAQGSADVGGILGYGDSQGIIIKKITNNGAVLAQGGSGTLAAAGGIIGHAAGLLKLNDEDTPIINNAAVTITGGSQAAAGGIAGKIDSKVVFSNMTTNTGAVTVNAPAGEGTAAGALVGATGTVASQEVAITFVNTAPVTNNGRNNVYTGGIAGYTGSKFTWTHAYVNTQPVSATGTQNVATGGFVGYAAEGLVLTHANAAAFENTAAITASGSTKVYTGGIAGYDKDGNLNQVSSKGALTVQGSSEVYTGGIAGYELGGTIASATAGKTADVLLAITSPGTIGGIAGYLEGTVNGAAVKNATLQVTSAGGVIGGIAGNAQGSINGVTAGDSASQSYSTLILKAAVTTPAEGQDNITFGGLVGVNTKPLTLTGGKAARISFLNETGTSGYTIGGAAGTLTKDAVIGTVAVPVEVQDIKVELKADKVSFGGGAGNNSAAKFNGHTNRIDIKAAGASVKAGGMFGENHSAEAAEPYNHAENVIITATGADNQLGGNTGLSTGQLINATVTQLSIEAKGVRAEVGGIIGHSEGAADRALVRTAVLNVPGFDPMITLSAADSKAGAIAGTATTTDIKNPEVNAEDGSEMYIRVLAAKPSVGGLAGTLTDSSITSDSKIVNLEGANILVESAATDAYIGGMVGYNEASKLEGLVGTTINLAINAPRAVAGGVAGYNHGSASGIIANSYISTLNLKANAGAVSSKIGGIVGLNAAQSIGPVLNPAAAISTIQNTRTLGSVSAESLNSIVGGMVGENNSLIANNSITDKITVISRGNNSIIGGHTGVNTSSGTLYYTYSNANLTVENTGTHAGGLAGENAGVVIGSYVDIDVTSNAKGTSANPVYLGGLIGRNTAGTVEQSYSSSKVTGNNTYTIVGGLVGELSGGTIKNSYVAKSVAATKANSYVGGFIGRITDGKVSNVYSAAEVTAGSGAYAGGFAGRYDNASKELLYKSYYIKDEALNINSDLPDFAEGNHRWLNVHVRLTTILSETLKDRTVFPGLSGWDFDSAWKYGSLNAVYQYPEVNRTANTGGEIGNEVNANINWYMKDKNAINFQITTEAELAGLAGIVNGSIAGAGKFDFADRTVTIMNPIHIQSKQWVPIGDKKENPFEGTFEGSNHLIDGLTLQPVYTYSGLFGVIGTKAVVQNINLEPLSVAGNGETGVLAGINLGTVKNADLKLLNGLKVSGGIVGGLIGSNSGPISGLNLTLDGGSRIETIADGGIAGGLIGENNVDLTAADYVFHDKEGSIGSAADNALVGGLIGVQTGDVTGLSFEVNSRYKISTTGVESVTGGMIGQFISGRAADLKLTFADGTIGASGLDSILGGIIGQSDRENSISNVTVSGSYSGIQLTANGTVGGVVGAKEGKLGGNKLARSIESNSFDIDHAVVQGVKLVTTSDSLKAVIGGLAGRTLETAINDVRSDAAVQAAGETILAGGILGEGHNSILYNADASSDLQAAAKNGDVSVGGIAGAISADDINRGFDFGKGYPLYSGIYMAKVHNGNISVAGTDNTADLYAGGIAGKNTHASIYSSEIASGLKVSGGNTANAGGVAGYSSGIIVDTIVRSGLQADTSRVYNVGGLVGWGFGGEIHYSKVISGSGQAITVGSALTLGQSVPATRAGGAVGLGDVITITHSHTDIPVLITDTNQDNTIYAGGFAGLLGDTDTRSGQIQKSYATGKLNVSGRLGSYVGGFAGSVDHFLITDSYASGDISNTGFDTRSGGFAAEVERSGSISNSYALQSKISTIGVKSSTRSYNGGFAGYNDGTLTGVYANVPEISVSVTGSNVSTGALVGYNFRDGKISGSSYTTGTLTAGLGAVGRNPGTAAGAVKTEALNPLSADTWLMDYDTTFLNELTDGTITVQTPLQLAGAVMFYNETGLNYYKLFNRTAENKPELGTILLGADINLAGSRWIAFDSFQGVFDGQGHTVSGLSLKTAEQQTAGFVKENHGRILNVTFTGAELSGAVNSGIAAGINHKGAVIQNVKVSGSVAGSSAAGGAAGVNQGTIEQVTNEGVRLSGQSRIGGIAGRNAGAIHQAVSKGIIDVTATLAAGGIAGENSAEGTITESMSYGDIYVASAQAIAGGISGLNAGEIKNSYSGGSVSADGMSTAWAGGIAGLAESGTITSSLNTGEVKAGVKGKIVPLQAFFGGIAGQKSDHAAISQSLFNRQMLKNNIAYFNVNGLAVDSNNNGVRGLTAAELTGSSVPAGLDAGVWKAVSSFYPVLTAFDGTSEGTLASAALILSPQDLINRVGHGFTLSNSSSLSWSVGSTGVQVNGAAGSLTTGGSAELRATAGGQSRSIIINAAALKYPGSAIAPAATPSELSFSSEVRVELTTVEPGGVIYYTLDGTVPNETSQQYKEAIVLNNTTTVKAVTIAAGKEYSGVSEWIWTRMPSGGGGGGGGGTAPAPSPTPTPAPVPAVTAVAGTTTVNGDSEAPVKIAKNSKLKLTAPEGQTVYYTTDGSIPTLDSPKFSGELLITKNTTIKAITDKDDTVITIEYVVENAKYSLKSNAGEIKYIAAYPNGLFMPNAAITRYELIEALAPLLDMEEVNVGNLFNDVSAGNEALTGFFASAGIIEGYPDGGFGGTKGLTRAEFSKIMTTVLKLDVTEAGVTKQSDLKGHWAEKYVNALSKAGYVQGFPDGTFKPGTPITRAQAVVLINRIAGTKKLVVTSVRFKDLPATHWAYKDIMAAVK
ncbi:chitobiase/beta-hexosaminidase C-terminal domain-containing protein [Paenibacillus sp. MMS20-IR301]|uniref:chitobiase/beta-hexosaminidase C-terminal domain-containing protein n=1 Tax=Paenibacillus sp. MMS20-IR301 TaxID=2895946 RepID=UPI0028E28E15|nr:chitobiase/beta-hexosaminidase C-terminal domain-containing protein [Paenibacillus sp. MMS20-IR301]WNS46257.1 chitobiase/beta-hexosaminidase C-terminal domain-containing protein [Paenibacillus sp. MMS20-IR301]